MASNFMTVDTQHSDMIHDAELNYYSTLLATCSSDEKIKIYRASKQPYQLLCEIAEHHGPVWQVSWSHPAFGNLLASCSYDTSVKIFSIDEANGTYTTLYTYSGSKSSVNSIAWGPREYGLCLACASSDGSVTYITRNDSNEWSNSIIGVCNSGCNAVSWAPFRHIGSEMNNEKYMRIAVAASDNFVHILRRKQNGGDWETETKLANHTEWVRDVCWSPYTGVPYNLIASCGKDNNLFVWSQKKADEPWSSECIHHYESPVWKVSWSLTGNLLAVAYGTQQYDVWKQTYEDKWECISSKLNEATN